MQDLFLMLDAGRKDPLSLAVLADRLTESQDSALVLAVLRHALYLDLPHHDFSINDFNLPVRARKAIYRILSRRNPLHQDPVTLADVCTISAAELLEQNGFGISTLSALRNILKEYGFALANE